MQMTGSMFLDDKTAPASLTATSRANWLRLCRFAEVSFCRIWFQSFTALRALHALPLEVTSQFSGQFLNLFEYWLEEVADLFYTLECLFRCEEQRIGILALQCFGKLIPTDWQRDVRTIR